MKSYLNMFGAPNKAINFAPSAPDARASHRLWQR